MNNLLINLSYLHHQPTGLSNYAKGVLPYLDSLNPLLLTSQNFPERKCLPVSPNLSSSEGKKGHLKRLCWTQFKLPKIYRQSNSNLVFSPVPEAPLFTDCRYIATVHDLIPLRFPNKKSPIYYYCKYYVSQVLDQAEHIICNSQTTADDIIDFFGIHSSKITPTLLGYDAEKFRVIDSLSPPKKKFFLYIGRYDSHKNLDRLLEAFSHLKQDVELLFVGPKTKAKKELQEKAQDLDIHEQIQFLDYVGTERLIQLLNQATALVFPSLWEGFGLPLVEAMACGTPVITSNCSSLQEIANGAGLLIDPYNPQELTDAMREVLVNNDLAQSLRIKGLTRAKDFSWESTGVQLCDVLKKFI